MPRPKNHSMIRRLIRLDDDFEGDITQVAKHVGLSKSRAQEIVSNLEPKLKGHTYEDLGRQKLVNIIQVTTDDEVFTGTSKEVAEHFFYARSTVDCMLAKGAKLGGRDIKVIKREWIEI